MHWCSTSIRWSIGFSWLLAIGIVGCQGQQSGPAGEGASENSPGVAKSTTTDESTSDEEPTDIPPAQVGKTDAERIADIKQIAGMVEQYRRITGRYPFAEAFEGAPAGALPHVHVNISSQPLPEEFLLPPPGSDDAMVSSEQFEADLQEVLGPGVKLPSDDAPLPRFYQYHFDGTDYHISAALYEPTDETVSRGSDWHEYRISSASNEEDAPGPQP